MKKKVLVWGWYNHSNLGDDLFQEAYRHLFPEIEFSFTDTFDNIEVAKFDAIFFGGGSFLLDDPKISLSRELLDKPIFYLGVGVEKDIHPVHHKLMSKAKLIATRSPDQVGRLKTINPNSIYLPDLVFSLQSQANLHLPVKQSKPAVLILSNSHVLPQQSDPHWKHAAWSYFQSEFVQFLDILKSQQCHLSFFSMCRDHKMDDDWMAQQVISSMNGRDSRLLSYERPTNFRDLANLVSRYDLIITQRYHGMVVSEMCEVPHITISHHDKFNPTIESSGLFLNYYRTNKQELISAFEQSIVSQPMPSDYTANFRALQERVRSLL